MSYVRFYIPVYDPCQLRKWGLILTYAVGMDEYEAGADSDQRLQTHIIYHIEFIKLSEKNSFFISF